MLTFLEFYQTFVSFVNYRLYTSINLIYPPKIDIEKDEAGAGLAAYFIQSSTEQSPVQTEQPATNTLPVKDTTKQLASLPSKIALLSYNAENPSETAPTINEDALDVFISADPDNNLPQPNLSLTPSTNSLFHGLHIYLSRETPVDALTFLLLSFGVSSLSTEPTAGPSPYPESDSRITHQICDRGKLPANLVPGRKYVQPQWTVDSINRGQLLDESAYIPGAELPPHLSPFVEKQDWKYDPEAPMDAESEGEVEQVDENEGDDEQEYQRLVVAEATGENATEKKKEKKKKAATVVDEDKEAKEMAKMMMSNKNRRLLDAMEYGNRKRKVETEKLQNRKRELIREERKRKKVKLS